MSYKFRTPFRLFFHSKSQPLLWVRSTLNSGAVILTMGSGNVEAAPSLGTPMLGSDPPRRKIRILSIALSVALLLALALVLVYKSNSGMGFQSDLTVFPWTSRMLRWQRAGYHFRTIKNYMTGGRYSFFTVILYFSSF